MHHDRAGPGTSPLSDDRRELGGSPHSVRSRQHGTRTRAGRGAGTAAGTAGRPSGRQLAATLATACSENGPAGTRTHAQPEAVGLGTATVVGLKGPLAHDTGSIRSVDCPPGGRLGAACNPTDTDPGGQPQAAPTRIADHGTDRGGDRSNGRARRGRAARHRCDPSTGSGAATPDQPPKISPLSRVLRRHADAYCRGSGAAVRFPHRVTRRRPTRGPLTETHDEYPNRRQH
jgi:hypothetical protein